MKTASAAWWNPSPGWVWLGRMAWRETRSRRRRLLLFSLTIVLGIAGLVAVGSLGRNMEDAIQDQAKTLLGADLVVTSRRPFSEALEARFAEWGGEQRRALHFASMLYFPRTGDSRLVQVRAVEPGFPFYGEILTEPPPAATAFRGGQGLLVEANVLTQFGVAVGDAVRLGRSELSVTGSLLQVPGENVTFASLAPRVYLPYETAEATGLVAARSLLRYKVYFRFPPETDVEALVDEARDALRGGGARLDTVETRKRELGRSMENLYHFLNLTAFVALLLGGVGIGSAIHVHVREKLGNVAVLRCLGASVKSVFAIYLLQAAGLAAAGCFGGVVLGLLLLGVLPGLVGPWVPFEFESAPVPSALFGALGVGFGACLLFALAPLLAVRRVTPLAAVRQSLLGEVDRRDRARWVVHGLLALGVLGFSIAQSRHWEEGVGFAGGLAVVVLSLAGLARLLTRISRRLAGPIWPWAWRQGLANLYRPNNRTGLLLLSLGLGTFLLLTLHLSREQLLLGLFPDSRSDRPNAILFEIQQDQREGVMNLLKSQGLPVLQEAPIVNMRLQSVKGVPVHELLVPDDDAQGGRRREGRRERADDGRIPRWVLEREYRSSYRDHLTDAETLLSGEFVGQFQGDWDDVIPVSVEDGIAEDLQVGLGDRMTFDVQGLPLTVRVASLREVDWRRIQPNFFVLFPAGILEEAPAMHILSTRLATPEISARMQRAVVQAYPNVSVIDLTLVLQTLDALIEKVGVVVRFMSLLTVATGMLVLVAAVWTGRFQRIRESVLLRTLGASRAQIRQVLFAEYALLGLFGGLAGTLLAVGGAWAMCRFLFEIDFRMLWAPVMATVATVMGLTILTGLLASRGVTTHPPLQGLRENM